jgi:hypothetical protein
MSSREEIAPWPYHGASRIRSSAPSPKMHRNSPGTRCYSLYVARSVKPSPPVDYNARKRLAIRSRHGRRTARNMGEDVNDATADARGTAVGDSCVPCRPIRVYQTAIAIRTVTEPRQTERWKNIPWSSACPTGRSTPPRHARERDPPRTRRFETRFNMRI